MALRPQDKKHVANLTEAAAFLRDSGKEDWAASVDLVLSGTREGSEFLNRLRVKQLRQSDEQGEFGKNLPIYMPAAVRDEIKAGVAKVPGITVSSEANKALQAFLDGEFTPVKPQRAAHGSAPKMVNLNVRVDPDLRQRAEDYGADHASQFGFAPRASHIIAGWLIRNFTEAGQKSMEAGQ